MGAPDQTLVGAITPISTQDRDTTAVPLLMRIPVPWVFVLAYLIGVTLNLILPINVRSTEALWMGRMAGIAVLALGVLIAFSALRLFHRSSMTTVPFETPTKLVTSGPYRASRNPMYWGLMLMYLGVGGTQGQVWPLIVLPLLLGYLDRLVIPVEERRLLQVFGNEYHQYCARVRRWL